MTEASARADADGLSIDDIRARIDALLISWEHADTTHEKQTIQQRIDALQVQINLYAEIL